MLVNDAEPVDDCDTIEGDAFAVAVDDGEDRDEPVATGVDVGI